MKKKIVVVDDASIMGKALKRPFDNEPFDFLWFNPAPQGPDQTDAAASRMIPSGHRMAQIDSIKLSNIHLCDICETQCTAETIQIHNSLHLCLSCYNRLATLPSAAIHNLARFVIGNVL